MFGNNGPVITKVLNPLRITKDSLMEFSIGELANTGLYRFTNIIELCLGEKKYVRYLLYSKSEDTEYVFEAFPGNGGQMETYLYGLTDTVPFSEDFLEVAGQRFLNTPQGYEYQRCVMPDAEERLDGIGAGIRVYNIETDAVEKEYGVKLWEYQRDAGGKTEYLTIEMSEENGMFRIFTGEMLEDIFYKVYQTAQE